MEFGWEENWKGEHAMLGFVLFKKIPKEKLKKAHRSWGAR